MSDDVSALFAKKREKKLKKNVVKMDDVSQVLERRAKKQVLCLFIFVIILE